MKTNPSVNTDLPQKTQQPVTSDVELMRAFAYPIGEPVSEYGLVELKEFSISADAASIRALANFMLAAADKNGCNGRKIRSFARPRLHQRMG